MPWEAQNFPGTLQHPLTPMIRNWFAEAPPLRVMPKAYSSEEELRGMFAGAQPRHNRRRLRCGPSLVFAALGLALYAGVLILTSPGAGGGESAGLPAAEGPAPGATGREPVRYAVAEP